VKSLLTEILSPFPVSAFSINSDDFTHNAKLARQHGVEMLFYSRLKKLYTVANICVDDYLKQNERAYLSAIAQSMRQEAMGEKIVCHLSNQNIPACIIKGHKIARNIYEDPNCRSSADIDVLIRTSDLIAADKILHQNGFACGNSSPLPFCIGRRHHMTYNNLGNNCPLELHWDFSYPLYFNLTPDEIWKGVVESNEKKYSLTPEAMVIMLMTHHFRHGFRELKILTDILWSFHRYDGIIDWKEFAEKLKTIGLVKSTEIILDQLDSLWNLSDGPLESFKILREQIASFSIPTPKYLLRYFHMDIEKRVEPGTMDMQMSKLVIDQKSKVFYSFVKIFFPRPQDIRALYPETANWMLPVNYLRFFCWRVTKSTIFLK
jgi:hypothetical protein